MIPELKPAGDSALLISFGEIIDEEINGRVHTVARAIEKAGFEWLVEVVPAYSSLLVLYDPLKATYAEVESAIKPLLNARSGGFEGRLVEVPVVYGGQYGPDIEFVAEHNGLTVDDVVEILSLIHI